MKKHGMLFGMCRHLPLQDLDQETMALSSHLLWDCAIATMVNREWFDMLGE